MNCQIARPRVRSAMSFEPPIRAVIRVRSSNSVANTVQGEALWSKPRIAAATAPNATLPVSDRPVIPPNSPSHAPGIESTARR